MRVGFSLFLVALIACPPPVEQTCQRVLVDSSGNLNEQGFGGGPATADAPPLGVVGEPLSVTVFAPLTSCVSDVLRADVQLLDPDNLPLVTAAEEPTRVGAGVVKSTLRFTPLRSGLHTLKVSFEPSLGARSLLIEVAAVGLDHGVVTRVPLDANCQVAALWPLGDDTVACEERGGGLISLTSSDGGLSRFAGEELVVVDTVLWSINAPSAALERRVFEGGGVRLTHSFAHFPSKATPAMHDVDVALRFRGNGGLTLVRLGSAGDLVKEFALDGLPGPPLAYFVEDDDKVYRWSDVECLSSACVDVPGLVGLEPGFVWRAGEPFEGATLTSGFARPTIGLNATPRFTLRYPLASTATPAHGFERMPLWLNTAGGDLQVLVSVEAGVVTFTAWPRGEVLRVGRHHLVLSDPDPGFVRNIKYK